MTCLLNIGCLISLSLACDVHATCVQHACKGSAIHFTCKACMVTEYYCNHILLPYSYSLYEPKSHALMEYNGGLEKAILRDSELLSEVNDAFCKSHPLLAQKVVTRSARAAVSKIGADALVSKALSVRRAKAGSLLKTIREVNALRLEENDILVGHGYHTAGSEPYFFIYSYTYTKRLEAIPVDLNGRCVVAEEIGDRDKDTMRPLKWKCTEREVFPM